MAQLPQLCPLCHKDLTLRQINFTEAIYMCDDLSCPYPVNSKCTVVKRTLDQIGSKKDDEESKTEDLGLDNWVEEVLHKEATNSNNIDNLEINWEDIFDNPEQKKNKVVILEQVTIKQPASDDLDEMLNFLDHI